MTRLSQGTPDGTASCNADTASQSSSIIEANMTQASTITLTKSTMNPSHNGHIGSMSFLPEQAFAFVG